MPTNNTDHTELKLYHLIVLSAAAVSDSMIICYLYEKKSLLTNLRLHITVSNRDVQITFSLIPDTVFQYLNYVQ